MDFSVDFREEARRLFGEIALHYTTQDYRCEMSFYNVELRHIHFNLGSRQLKQNFSRLSLPAMR